jgi:hypothetical protein
MASLKDKAKAKSKQSNSKSKLATKAKAKSSTPQMRARTVDEVEREEGLGSTPVMHSPTSIYSSSPLPPALAYLRKLATIPALREKEEGGQ